MVSWVKIRLLSTYPVHTLLGSVGQDVQGGSMEAALLFVNSCTLELLWND